MLLIPMAYKMGVLSTVLGIILLLSLKSVMIGKLILLMNFGLIVFKISSLFYKHKGEWDPKKNIHIHLYGTHNEHQGWGTPGYIYDTNKYNALSN